jgi:hypothetical protein
VKAGYFESKNYFSNQIGTSAQEGSSINSILANIYMNEVDKYILSLKKDFYKGICSPRTKLSRSLEFRIYKAKLEGNTGLLKEIKKEANKIPASDYYEDNSKNIAYVRYADNFIIGIKGSYQEAKEIKEKFTDYLNNRGLGLNEEKTKITNINKDRVMFLGTNLFRSNNRTYMHNIGVEKNKFSKSDRLNIRLEAPLKIIIKKLSESQYMAKGKPSPKYI